MKMEKLEPRTLLAGEIIITEFMANNDSGATDTDGDFSDWIELHNTTNAPFDVDGWSLTDNSGNLTKWQLPAETIPGNDYLLVFASGKDRAIAGQELHTNFQLSSAGEYLALVEGDGTTIATEFAPQYPVQVQDVSYGASTQLIETVLVSEGDGLNYLIPTGAADQPADWNAANFDDSSWNTGTSPIGFDTQQDEITAYHSAVLAADPVAYYRLNEESGTTAENIGSGGAGLDGTYVGGVDLTVVGPRPPGFSTFDLDNTAANLNAANEYVNTSTSILSNLSSFTMMGWVKPGNITANRVGLFGQNDAVEFGYINPNTIQLWTPGGGNMNYTHSTFDGNWHHITAVGAGTNLQLYVDGALVATGGSNTNNYGSSGHPFRIGGGGIYDGSGNQYTGDIDEVAVYHRALSAQEISDIANTTSSSVDYLPIINTDVQAVMHGNNATALVRHEFNIANDASFDSLRLRMKSDDGFVAFLNGHEIASRNAPAVQDWNAAATATNPDSDAVVWEIIDVSDFRDFLVVGDNVLAIQGLNVDASNTDFLLSAELDAADAVITTTNRYFVTPTPEGPNGTGSNDLGPILRNEAHNPLLPSVADAVIVTVEVAQSFDPVSTVDMHYRVMFGAEVTVAMADDGLGDDAVAADGIFTATIPAGAAASGEMLRWYFTSDDTAANESRWPLFNVQTGRKQSAEYFGTVITNPNLSGNLPVIQTFLPNEAAAQTRSGSRVSIFYADEFYDNAFIRQRGGSTTGAPKDSLKVEFNSGGHFRYDPNLPRAEEINLNTTYSDKAYIRQPLAFDVYSEVGTPGSISFNMRLEMNNTFHSVTSFIEQVDTDLLVREGLDPDGALYKMFNQFTSSSSVEKKTRQYEDNSDLASFVSSINSLSGTALTNYIFDNIDVPTMLNYLSGTVLVHQNDHPHKNHYLYRDSNGTGEWFFIPWDNDLTFGSNWVGTSFADEIYADNDSVPGRAADVQPSHPFIGASGHREWNNHWNRLTDKLLSDDRFKEMYVRRLRTTADDLLGTENTPVEDRWLDVKLDAMETMNVPDAQLDFNRWANPWNWGSNQSAADAIDIIRDDYLVRRRTHLFDTHNVDSNYFNKASIPHVQVEMPQIDIVAVDFNPASGNQDEEYIQLDNPNSVAVDISGWKLKGAVSHTFKEGTVIEPGGSLYVSPHVPTFRARAAGPSGGQGLFVQGEYNGHLSNFGETLELENSDNDTIDTFTYAGDPSDLQQFFRITEINYNPSDPTADELIAMPLVNNDDFEFIEVKNIGAQPLMLDDATFTDGVAFDFTGIELQTDEIGIIVKNQAAFEVRYGAGLNILGAFASGSLNNGGEIVKVEDATNSTVFEVNYNDSSPWPAIADGKGATLELIDVNSSSNDVSNWRHSTEYFGSPGADGVGPVDSIVINEVLSNSDPAVDRIELYNPTGSDINIGHWYLSDACGEYRKYQFPANTMLLSGEYLTIDESDFNSSMGVDLSDFALNGAHGDELFLMEADGANTLLSFIEVLEFEAALPGESLGRWPNGTGDFTPLTANTFDAVNSPPRIGPVIIHEFQYNPTDPGVGFNSDDLEFVELLNTSGLDEDLTNWEIQGGIDFAFPAGTMLPSGELLVIVSFDPIANPTLETTFRTFYDVDPAATIIGGYSGRLGNSGDTVRLLRADAPPLDEPNFIPLVLEDEVTYDDVAPWPVTPDGQGPSLNRATPVALGNDVSSWNTDVPSPGLLAPVQNLPPTVAGVTFNTSFVDPADLAGKGEQPTSWSQQRSDIRAIHIEFSEVVTADETDFALVNLGVDAPVDTDVPFALTPAHISINGTTVTLSFDNYELGNGVYRLDVLASVIDIDGAALDGNDDGTPGDAFAYQGDVTNKFYKLISEFSGDAGVSVFDFSTFSYWFGTQVPDAPAYADMNVDGGISVFDFTPFSNNFGTGIDFPVAFAGTVVSPLPEVAIAETPTNPLEQQLIRVELPVDIQVVNRRDELAFEIQDRSDNEVDDLLEAFAADVAEIWQA
jgi:hypothetical protein